MTSAPAIGFEYAPSRRLAWLLIAITVLAELAIALSGMPPWLQWGLAAGACAACRAAVHGLRLPIRAVGWAHQAGWTLHDADGADEEAILLSFRSLQGMLLLRLGSARHGRLTLWLLPDNSDADTRRRLRMRLAVPQGD